MIELTEEEIMESWKKDKYPEVMISIKCITYNHERYISQALDSFLIQKTEFPFEVVVHDDASTDKTAEIIRQYEKKFPKIIKPIYEIENQYSKPGVSLNSIIMPFLTGKYIAFCEGDDYWCSEDKLQKQFEIMEQYPEYPICVHTVKKIDKEGRSLNSFIPEVENFSFSPVFDLQEVVHVQYGMTKWSFQISSYFTRRDLYQEFIDNKPDFYKKFPFGDIPLLFFLLSKGNGYYLKDEMSCYRVMSGGYMTRMKIDKDFSIKTKTRIIEGVLTYDEGTGYKYHDDLMVRVTREQFLIDEINENYKNLWNKEYRKYYLKTKSIKYRFKVFIKAKFTFVYKFVKKK